MQEKMIGKMLKKIIGEMVEPSFFPFHFSISPSSKGENEFLTEVFVCVSCGVIK
jgi:hypothetical protein